ncbi:MAG: hypothetical protein PHW04_17905 [Candidatus Wallbacteria bacterium]|nr:hypothetical protein [Candidatus Wallbacteria bacterium]
MKKTVVFLLILLCLPVFAGPKENELFSAVDEDNYQKVKVAVLAGADLNARNSEGLTAVDLEVNKLKDKCLTSSKILDLFNAHGAAVSIGTKPATTSPAVELCLANMRTLESALEMVLMENTDKILDPIDKSGFSLDFLKPWIPGNTIPTCPAYGMYFISGDREKGYYLECSEHGTVDSPKENAVAVSNESQKEVKKPQKEASVTMTFKSTAADAVIMAIAKTTGINIVCPGSLAEKRINASFKNTPAGEALSDIALQLGTTLQKTEKGYVFIEKSEGKK